MPEPQVIIQLSEYLELKAKAEQHPEDRVVGAFQHLVNSMANLMVQEGKVKSLGAGYGRFGDDFAAEQAKRALGEWLTKMCFNAPWMAEQLKEFDQLQARKALQPGTKA